MARKLLRRFFPGHSDIKNNRALHFLGDLLNDPNLFHLNKRSVSVAFFWGLFIAMLPIPGQMAVSASAAIFFRCNLPICVALAWITNPVTMVFFFYIAYALGSFVLQVEASATATAIKDISFGDFWDLILDSQYNAAISWLGTQVGGLWKPFVLGSILCGLLFGSTGYCLIQLYWRWHVVRQWNKRKKQRQKNTD